MTEPVAADLVTRTWSRRFEPPGSIPGSAEVVIIGGGIIGVSTAWFLARQGARVALCEKGHIAGEQSGRNWGWVRQQGRDAREMPMILESLSIWRGLAEAIGEDVGFAQTGCLYAARTDAELEGYASWLPTAREHGLDTRMVSSNEIARLAPGATATWTGGIYTPSDGQAEPHKAAPAIARAAARNGASILRACAVRGYRNAGRTRIGRRDGTRFDRDTGGTLRSGSLDVDVLPVARYRAASTHPERHCHTHCARCEGAEHLPVGQQVRHTASAGRRLQRGAQRLSRTPHRALHVPLRAQIPAGLPAGVRWCAPVDRARVHRCLANAPARWRLDAPSPFEKTRVLNPKPRARAVAGIRSILAERFPRLAGIGIAEAWSGVIETTPDAVPVIDEAEALPGFYIATGLSGHGFGIGPGAGKAIAGLLTGADTSMDLSEFRLGRFFDGTPIRFQD